MLAVLILLIIKHTESIDSQRIYLFAELIIKHIEQHKLRFRCTHYVCFLKHINQFQSDCNTIFSSLNTNSLKSI